MMKQKKINLTKIDDVETLLKNLFLIKEKRIKNHSLINTGWLFREGSLKITKVRLCYSILGLVRLVYVTLD